MRLDEPDQVDLVLGDGARERGAACHEISEDTLGVAWVKSDGRREIERLRAFHPTAGHLAELSDYVTGGGLRRLASRRGHDRPERVRGESA
jgi:DNA segregation ATPase FtsK/SpoIIIE, S-DNA-T family